MLYFVLPFSILFCILSYFFSYFRAQHRPRVTESHQFRYAFKMMLVFFFKCLKIEKKFILIVEIFANNFKAVRIFWFLIFHILKNIHPSVCLCILISFIIFKFNTLRIV